MAKCDKLLMSSVFVVWLVNGIVEPELCFLCVNIVHCNGQIGQNMSSKFYNILRRYHTCIKFDNQRKMLLTFDEFFFVVWHVNEIFESKLAYFDKYLSMERINKAKYV